MPAQSVAVLAPKKESTPAKKEDLFDRIQHLHDAIARRAFELFEGDGGFFGHDLEHWFKAESDFLHPVHIELTESDEGMNVQAEVPGFSPKELEISVEPRRLTITGKRETQENAVSVASTLLLTEATLTEVPEPKAQAAQARDMEA